MTDQPTKGPFYNAQWTMIFDYMVRVDRLTDRAEFSGPNREANAALFIRAQHMDELLEWATKFVALEDNALKEWANESLVPWTGDEPCMVRLRRLKAILAKIKEQQK